MKYLEKKRVPWRFGEITIFKNDEFVGRSLEIYGEWAQQEISFLKGFIESENCQNVVIAGANIGVQTLAFSNYMGTKGSISSFEVHPEVFSVLKENVENSFSENVELFNYGLWDKKSKIKVSEFIVEGVANFGGYSINEDLKRKKSPDSNVEEIDLFPLDDLYTSKCDLIFLDVEGGELNVLQGAKQIIQAQRPFIYGEARNLEEAIPIYTYLKSFGYELFLHMPLAFNPDNFHGNPFNIFGPNRETALWAIPCEAIDSVPLSLVQTSCLHRLQNYGDLVKKLGDLPYFDCQLYWANSKDSFSEENSEKKFLTLNSSQHFINFQLTDIGPVGCLRFDIGNKPGLVKFDFIKVITREGAIKKVLLNLDTAEKINAFCDKSGLEYFRDERNGIFLVLSDCAHFVFDLPEILISEIFEVEISLKWPSQFQKFYKTQKGIFTSLEHEIERYMLPQKEVILGLTSQVTDGQKTLSEEIKSLKGKVESSFKNLEERFDLQKILQQKAESRQINFEKGLENKLTAFTEKLEQLNSEQKKIQERQKESILNQKHFDENLQVIQTNQSANQHRGKEQITVLEQNLSENFEVQIHKLEKIQLALEPKKQKRFKMGSTVNIKTFLFESVPVLSTFLKKRSLKRQVKILKQHFLFEEDYYIEQNPDVAASPMDPARHYLVHGGFENRNPSAAFDSSFYLEQYNDVSKEGWNPLLHYILYGKNEKRIIKAVTNNGVNVHTLISPDQGRHTRHSSQNEKEYNEIEKQIDHVNLISRVKTEENYQVKFDPGMPGYKTLAEAIAEKLQYQQFVITFSHDDYLKSIGGIQLYLQDEQNALLDNEISYIQLFPTIHRPFELSPDPLDFQLTIQVDGHKIGSVKAVDLAWAISELAVENYRCISLNLHHLMSWNLKVVEYFLEKYPLAKKRFFLHDYFTICPQYNLLFNGRKFCGAPSVESNACTICKYGRTRQIYFPMFQQIFEKFKFEVIAPSEFALELWMEHFEIDENAVKIIPHQNLEKEDRSEERKSSGNKDRIRIAFLGHESYHKGWQTWRKLVSLLEKNKEYSLFHFGSRITGEYPEKFLPVVVSHSDRNAMQKQLEQHQIDLVFLWAIWPETYSYTYFESLSAGCFVITHVNSGNIAQQVNKRGNGIVLSSEEELFDFVNNREYFTGLLMKYKDKKEKKYSLSTNLESFNLLPTNLKN